jgi:hypothetical protein
MILFDMSIENTLVRLCKQIAVYWANPVNDGYGGKTYAVPVEIQCRWEDRNETFLANTGNLMVSRSVVYPLIDLDQEGILFLGKLADLTTAEKNDPRLIDAASSVKRFDIVPILGSTTEFVRKAYLTSKNMQ